MAAKFAVSLMALLGAVSAQTGYTNSSSIATTTSSSASATFSNGAMVTAAGVVYTIMDDTTYSDVTPLQLSRKRQASSGIGSCLNTCSDNAQCAGASYSDDTMRCSYYSSINQDSEASSPGTDFALVESRPKASSSANSTTSATGSATAPGVSSSSNSTRSATSSRPAGITGGAGNSTSSRPTGSASRTSSSTGSSTPVPSSPSTIITIRGVSFLLEIDINYSGITIDFTILSKRAGQSLDDCLNTCAANSNCAGTSFEESTGTCTFFTSIDSGSRTPTNGVDFATVLSRANANNGSGSGNNGTSGAGNSTSPATNATAESFICPKLNGGVLVSNLEITFAISCSEFLIGTTFDLLSTVSTKRQAVENGLPQTLSNCVDLCSLSAECVGTTFSEATGCSYYSDVRYATPMDGFDSAVKVQDNSGNGVITTTVIAGQTVTTTVAAGTTTQYVGAASTATVYVTSVSTVTSYVGGATGLPSGATVTQIVPVSTITYNPSVSTITLPQNYAGQTVTVTQGAGAAAPTVTESVTVTVDQNGNVVGESTNVAGAAGGAGSYPTVTVHDLYCPTSTAPSVVWTTVFVR